MEDNRNKLGSFLKEVSNWNWDKFVKAEKNHIYTTNESLIFALVRACTLEKIEAIKITLNRIDGKLKTPIKIEFPKVFFLYPNAKLPDGQLKKVELLDAGSPDYSIEVKEKAIAKTEEKPDLPSMSLRQTLTKMADYPRNLPDNIIKLSQEVEASIRVKSPMPDEIPAVKSVVAAHLLIMAQRRNLDALAEVFDQIDGKLVETLQILGEDIFITSYSLNAPDGAYLNKDGVLQIEAEQTQNLWAEKLGGSSHGS